MLKTVRCSPRPTAPRLRSTHPGAQDTSATLRARFFPALRLTWHAKPSVGRGRVLHMIHHIVFPRGICHAHTLFTRKNIKLFVGTERKNRPPPAPREKSSTAAAPREKKIDRRRPPRGKTRPPPAPERKNSANTGPRENKETATAGHRPREEKNGRHRAPREKHTTTAGPRELKTRPPPAPERENLGQRRPPRDKISATAGL